LSPIASESPKHKITAMETVVLQLYDVLETVAEFRSASVELLAWEFDLPPSAIERTWKGAIEDGLLRLSGLSSETGEAMFALTRLGEFRLQKLRKAHSLAEPGAGEDRFVARALEVR
jgi:hypothetical protein